MCLWRDILLQHGLFRGFSEKELDFALEYFSARIQSYKKGEFLHRAGEEHKSFGIVLRGTVHVFTDDIEGHQMMMASPTQGDTFGESLCYLRTKDASVYVFASADCTVLWLSGDRLHRRSESDMENEIKDRFTALLASRALSMNRRIQTLSKHSLREKLMTFFTDYVRRYGTAPFEVPFDRSGMATYLGADRSALSRELSAMKKEGIIDYSKNTFRFLQIPSDIE